MALIKLKSRTFPAIATLTGTIIGAGFLGIPYVISKSGFPIGLFYILFLGIIMLIVRLYLGEVILRTKTSHNLQLVGYAQKYLGRTGKFLIFFSMIFGIYSSIVAYLIGEGESLSFLFFNKTSYALLFGILFWLLMSILTYKGLGALKKFESVALVVVIGFIVIISALFASRINIQNLSYINYKHIFLPFGVILYAFLGTAVMPELERMLRGKEKLMKKVTIIGGIIPIIVYLLFTIVVVGAFSPDQIPEIATLALGRIFVFFGMVTMFTAFFSLSIALRDMYRFDFKLGRFKGWLLTMIIPAILFILTAIFNLATFTGILGLAGGVAGGIEITTILFMNMKAKKQGKRKPEYSVKINWPIIISLSILFILGIVYEVWKFFNV